MAAGVVLRGRQLALVAHEGLPGGIRAGSREVAGLVVGGDDDERLLPAALALDPVHGDVDRGVEVELLLDLAVQGVLVGGGVDRTALDH